MTNANRNFVPFEGGSYVTRYGAVGLGGIIAALVGIFGTDSKAAYHSYLVAFVYWLSISLGALCWLSAFTAAKAKWFVAVKRILEVMATSVLIFAVLFIPIVLGLKQIFPWVAPAADLGHEMKEMLHHKAPYLNVPFFLARAAGYFAIWIFLSHRLAGLSSAQDKDGKLEHTVKARSLATGSLPLLGLAITFAIVDWVMSLRPEWYSTVFGVYYIAGAFLSSMALLIIIANRARHAGLLGDVLNLPHFHSMGKFLLAFTCFWAYIAFSQFMLIWVANLPEETPWYLARMKNGWDKVGMFLMFGHFVGPFLVLLSAKLKWQPDKLAVVAGWMLFIHYVDMYWLVMPQVSEKFFFHWTAIPAFLGVGGIAIAFAVWRAGGRYPIPLRDPYLEHAARYNPS